MADSRAAVLAIAAVAAMGLGCALHVAPVATSAALAIVLGLGAARVTKSQVLAERHRRDAQPAELHGVQVHLHDGHGAATAGPLRPIVFLGRATVAELADDELRAVVLHEEAHRRAHDPLFALLGHLVAPVLFAQRAVARGDARREVLADRSALRAGATRAALARALLKVPSPSPDPVAVGFTSTTEARVRALLGGEELLLRRPTLTVALGLVLGALSCLASGHQVVMALA